VKGHRRTKGEMIYQTEEGESLALGTSVSPAGHTLHRKSLSPPKPTESISGRANRGEISWPR
jgi:hypothetical protein